MHGLTLDCSRLAALAYSPDGLRLALQGSPGARLWIWDRERETVHLVREGGFPGPIAFSPRGDLLALGREHLIGLCNLRTYQVRYFANRARHSTSTLAFTPDGKTLVSAGHEIVHFAARGSIFLGDVATGQERRLYTPFPTQSRPNSGSREGSLVLWAQPPMRGKAAVLTLWHIPARMKISQIHLATLPQAVAFSPDRTALAMGAGDVVLLWDLSTVLAHLEDELHGTPWAALTLPLRRNRIATRMPALAPPRRLEGHTGEVGCLAFSPDGTTLFSGGRDQMVRRWDVSSGQTCDLWEWEMGVVSALAVSEDGMTALAGGEQGRVILWDLEGYRTRRAAGVSPLS